MISCVVLDGRVTGVVNDDTDQWLLHARILR